MTEAIGNAQKEGLRAFAAEVTADRPAPRAPGGVNPPPWQPTNSGRRPLGDETQQALREMLTLIEAAGAQLDGVASAERERVTREHTGQDTGRHITVRVTGGGEFTQINADEEFLRRVRDDYVGRGLNDAFAAAYRNADTAAASKGAPDDALRELKALTDDPQELLRRLFGDR